VDLQIHLIIDNYATQKHPVVKAWLARHPRFHLHFTPTSSSRLNLVERFIRDLTEDVAREGSFGSVRELVQAMETYLAERNLAPQQYVWKKKGEENPGQDFQGRGCAGCRRVVMLTYLLNTTLAPCTNVAAGVACLSSPTFTRNAQGNFSILVAGAPAHYHNNYVIIIAIKTLISFGI